MKILLVNTVIRPGSVGRITTDLYNVITAAGHEAYLGIGREPWDEAYKGRVIGNKKDFYLHVGKNFLQGEAGFGSAEVTRAFLQYITELKPDLIHLHNIHGFYLQVEMLFSFLKKAGIPVVWTLHDCWPFTGHCAYYDYAACEKWKTGCHTCMMHAKTYPYAIFKDNTVNAYARKREAFVGVPNLHIVTPSAWLAGELKESFLREYPVHVIPNGIDLDVFSPKESVVGDNVKYILGVANIWEFRKGLQYFERLAEGLPDGYRVKLIGVDKRLQKKLKKKHGDKMELVGRTANIEELADAYRQAAVFVNPTLEDNLPTTNIEALACGTPVVTYQTGGSGEIADEKSGITVARGDYDALVSAVIRTANGAFSPKDCRKRAEAFDKKTCYGRYIELYEELSGGSAHAAKR
ncbi:MAG: glycosyltransferase [Lachnospiraceae bacterium]|nr:glycosyltransferase [Lachnospiraceae bacterium]